MRTFLFWILITSVFCIAQDAERQPRQMQGMYGAHFTRTGVANNAYADITASRFSAASMFATDALATADPAPSASLQSVLPSVNAKVSQKTALRSKLWWVLTAAQHGSAVFDARTTLHALDSGSGYERDPLVKPFAGSAAIYPALQVFPTGLDYFSSRMLESQHTIFKRLWWVPQTISTAGFIWCGTRNLHVAARQNH